MSKNKSKLSEPEQRSLELLGSIVEANEWAEYIVQKHRLITIRVKGRSNRWYLIEARLNNGSDPRLRFDFRGWRTIVMGGARKRDIIHKNRYCVNLCLSTHSTGKLPFGDKIAALCLSLHNDLTTAMTIPLLAQFIVCPRDELEKIMVFQDEMVIYREMFGGPMDGFGNPPYQETIEDEHEEPYPYWDDADFHNHEANTPPPEEHDPSLQEEPSPLTEEEIAEMRLWDAYEQHMEDLARQEEWSRRREEDR